MRPITGYGPPSKPAPPQPQPPAQPQPIQLQRSYPSQFSTTTVNANSIANSRPGSYTPNQYVQPSSPYNKVSPVPSSLSNTPGTSYSGNTVNAQSQNYLTSLPEHQNQGATAIPSSGSNPMSHTTAGPSALAPSRPSVSLAPSQTPGLKVNPSMGGALGPQHHPPPATPMRQQTAQGNQPGYFAPSPSQDQTVKMSHAQQHPHVNTIISTHQQSPAQSPGVIANNTQANSNTHSSDDVYKRLQLLQHELVNERNQHHKLQDLYNAMNSEFAELKVQYAKLKVHSEELERSSMFERKQRLEYEAVLDRLNITNHLQPNLRRISSSLIDVPPPPPPRTNGTGQASQISPNDYIDRTVKTPSPYNGTDLSMMSTVKAPSTLTHPTPEYNPTIPSPPPQSSPIQPKEQPQDSRHAITSNSHVDQTQAFSPLEDDWTFDTHAGGGFMSQDQMNNIIQTTLETWSSEFHFSKDVRDFMLLEIADIVEASPSEQLMKKHLERYHYDLMTSPYQIVRKIGSGGFGSVYQGVEKATGTPVGIKIISLEDTEDDVMVITREITALVQGHKCPQLVRYFGSDVKATKLWIMMEYINGGSLLDHVKIEPLAEKYIAIVAREVLLGLQYLNSEGKIHRDIKAANILIGTEGSVKLADFGASRALNDTMSKCNTFVGSPYWMAPDVITADGIEEPFKIDIWSLGITCIELATGKPPHTNVNPMAVLQVIIRDPPPQLVGNYSKDFQQFVSLCLIKDPKQRASVSDLLKTKFIKGAKPTKKIAELFGLNVE